MKALIVDDTIINIKVAQRLIEHEGLEVDYVMSGKECLEKVKEVIGTDLVDEIKDVEGVSFEKSEENE